MWIYSVDGQDDSSDGRSYFTSKAGAFKLARETARDGFGCSVMRSKVRKLRMPDLVAALLNGVGWADETEHVRSFEARDISEDYE